MNHINMRTKLFICFLALTLLSCPTIGAFIIHSTNQAMYREVSGNARIASEQLRDNLSSLLNNYVSVSDGYYSDMYFQAMLTEDYSSYLESLMAYQGYIKFTMQRTTNTAMFNRLSIYVDNESFLKDGSYICNLADIASEPIAQTAWSANGKVCWSAPALNKAGQPVFYMTRSLNTLNTLKPSGLFLLEIPVARINAFYSQESDKTILVVNGMGCVVSASSADLVGLDIHATPYAAFYDMPDGKQRQDGEMNIIAQTIRIANSTEPWRVFSFIPTADMYLSANQAAQGIALICLIGVLLSAVLSWILSGTLTKRLRMLSQNITKVREQNFSGLANISGTDEIGALAGDFQRMAARVDELINEVFKTQLERMELLVKQRDAQMNALQAKINPHFLFNTLDSIRMRLVVNENDKAQKMLTLLSKLFRYSIGREGDIVTLGQEIRNIQDYIQIFKLRYDDAVAADINAPEIFENCPLPRLTLQPIVENAFIHGFKNERGRLRLEVSVEAADAGLIRIVVSDDGSGITEKEAEQLNRLFEQRENTEGNGVGLKNVNERLCLFFGGGPVLHVERGESTGVRIVMTVPEKGVKSDERPNHPCTAFQPS